MTLQAILTVLADVGLGASALLMARGLKSTVRLLTEITTRHEGTLVQHEARIETLETTGRPLKVVR